MKLLCSMWMILMSTGLSALELHGTFSDHMVLQRNKPILIYGKAEPDSKVSVSFDGEKTTTKCSSSGQWQVSFKARKASARSLQILVKNEKKSLKIDDVVIGDVWICSGQSNMGWGLSQTQPLPKEFPHADKLRVLTGKLTVSPNKAQDDFIVDPKKSAQGWQRADREAALNTSAVSYYMGLEIVKKTDIPVGLIVVALGGSHIYPWMTPASINGHPEEQTAREEATKSLKWAKGQAQKFISQGNKAKAEKLLYSYEGKAPSALYNGMIHPLIKTPIAGMLWYQGERSQDDALPYRTFFPAAIKGWRQAWGQGDFPFVFIQLPAYFGEGRNEKRARGFSLVREAQAMALKLPKTGMAMALEFGHYSDVHPQEKAPVGYRAGLQALKLMGKQVLADGPLKKSIKLNGNKALIEFTSVGNGLEVRTVKIARSKKAIAATDPNPLVIAGSSLQGFEVAGKDGVFKKASAKIIGKNKVSLSSASVQEIAYVRYAFHQMPMCNLYNSAGLPAQPFRTDDFPVAHGAQ